jgi:DNA-binding NarL/FixJ family response regulator
MAKVLIVDDSPVLRKMLRVYLEHDGNGWEVCGEAENGLIAIDKVRVLNPDIVVLDLAMPVMNGLEAARHISAIAPKTIMVMFTMQECMEISRDAKAAGVREVVSKSGGAEQLLISMKTLLPA